MLRAFHSLTISKAEDILKSSQNGLTRAEAGRRLLEHGENNLPEESSASWIKILRGQFASPLTLILILAMIVSFVFKDFADAVMICLAVAINACVGFAQEFKANRALARLRSFIVHRVKVVRDDATLEVDAKTVVPGDVMLVHAGDRIAADARIISADAFEVDESILTGESMPIEKNIDTLSVDSALADRKNMVHSGTLVVRGRAKALVCSTGLDTEFGRIAEMISKTEIESSPLQEQFVKLGRFLALLYSISAIVIFAIGLLLGKSLFEMLILSIALAVAAVPESLPIAVTVILALGMQRMFKRKALVRRLVATETLGSVSVICTDKTGTITQALMEVETLVTADGTFGGTELFRVPVNIAEKAADICLLCNESDGEAIGSPTDAALAKFGEKFGYSKTVEEQKYSSVSVVPFDTRHKFMLTLVKSGAEFEILAKGAAEIILSSSSKILRGIGESNLDDDTKARLVRESDVMTSRGLRVMGLACKRISDARPLSVSNLSEMTFVGFVCLRDPVRESAKDTIAQAARAGVRTVIVTGDHPRTAHSVAVEVGIGDGKPRVCTGAELDKMSDVELEHSVEFYDVFARIESAHKVRIVNAWRAKGATVAMTGDGVNDAPALKAADIGVAQGGGTDVAKRVADMVLLDNNLETIVSAIQEGRAIFENIRKTTVYLLIHGFAEMNLILLSLIFGLPLPLAAAQILYLNFITDSLPAMALTFDSPESDVMYDKPQKRGAFILTSQLKKFVFGFGILLNVLPFLLYFYLIKNGYDTTYSMTMAFAALSLEAIAVVFPMRSYKRMLFRSSLFRNKFLLVAVAMSLAFTALAIYWAPLQKLLSLAPLHLNDWFLLSIIVLIKLILVEAYKYVAVVCPRRNEKILYAQAS